MIVSGRTQHFCVAALCIGLTSSIGSIGGVGRRHGFGQSSRISIGCVPNRIIRQMRIPLELCRLGCAPRSFRRCTSFRPPQPLRWRVCAANHVGGHPVARRVPECAARPSARPSNQFRLGRWGARTARYQILELLAEPRVPAPSDRCFWHQFWTHRGGNAALEIS